MVCEVPPLKLTEIGGGGVLDPPGGGVLDPPPHPEKIAATAKRYTTGVRGSNRSDLIRHMADLL